MGFLLYCMFVVLLQMIKIFVDIVLYLCIFVFELQFYLVFEFVIYSKKYLILFLVS